MKTTNNKKIVLAMALLLGCGYYAQAQMIEKDEPKKKIAKVDSTQKKKERKYDAGEAVLLVPNYTAQFPFANQKQRYSFNSLISMQVLYKTNTNWVMGVNGGFIYGKVKEDYLLSNIAAGGQLITTFNDLTSIKIEQWGMNIQFTAGKIIPFSTKYPDAGILLITGAGFLQNKIAYNVKASELPQLAPNYKKGYDRLDNGPVISQFIGGTFMARRKYIAGYVGMQIDAGFTRDRRPYDFYTMQTLTDNRIDLYVGIKIGYVLPIFLKASEKEFFYY